MLGYFAGSDVAWVRSLGVIFLFVLFCLFSLILFIFCVFGLFNRSILDKMEVAMLYFLI